MRQQLVDVSGAMCWQAHEHVLQTGARVMPVQLCRVDQTDDGSGTFSGVKKAFSDTVTGAKAGANLYSLVETCRANNADIYQYLIDLFKALPYANNADDYEALLPWKPGRPPYGAVATAWPIRHQAQGAKEAGLVCADGVSAQTSGRIAQ